MKKLFLFTIITLAVNVLFASNVHTVKSGDYHNPCIWSNNSVPSNGDNITINHDINFANQVYFFINTVTISSGVEMCGYNNIVVDNACNIYIYGSLKATSIVIYSSVYLYGSIITNLFQIPQSGGTLQIFGGIMQVTSSYTCNSIPNYTTLNPVTICSGDSALVFGEYKNISGNYLDTIPSTNGCDSFIYQELIVQFYNDTLTQSICDGEDMNFGTQVLNSAGYYSHTFNSVNSCDSVVTINLYINYATTSTETRTECNSYDWNGIAYTISGAYTYATTNSNGCDSTATLNLTINSFTSTPLASNQTACFGTAIPDLIATGVGSTFTWYSDISLITPVANNSPFSTGQTAAGTYTYYVTDSQNGCESPATSVTLIIYASPITGPINHW